LTTKNRFEQHQIIAWITILFLIFLFLEVFLRITNPAFVEFPYRLRQYLSYHRSWKADFIPNAHSWVRLRGDNTTELFSFLVSVSPDGFRTWDRGLDHHLIDVKNGTKIVHAIGDSHTMGWGLNYEATYPAQLDFLLPANNSVLNLGLNSFGTVAATEKSMHVWSKYPAILSIYLFCENDYDDDQIAMRHSRRPAVLHSIFDFWNFLRRNTYCANVPYAVYEWGYWKSLRTAGTDTLTRDKTIYAEHRDRIGFLKSGSAPSDPTKGILSKSALLRYKAFLDSQGVPLWVLCIGENVNSLDFGSFCSENGLEAFVMTVPESVTLYRDGHLNQLGNYQLAHFLYSRMKSRGIVK
jgi:hypothetical protein